MNTSRAVVGECVHRNRNFLYALVSTRPERERKKLLAQATDDEIAAILEICVNIMRQRFPLRSAERQKLSRHKDFLYKFYRMRSPGRVRRALQIGNGGVLGALIVPVLSALVSTLLASHS
ncbi:hypothetical protein AAVH_31297 [Aphelenchoides avenae]|nr:hypothetical protein AAVH_31297 [Aphelenchus avenae]